MALESHKQPRHDEQGQQWRFVPGFEGQYQISDVGCVRSVDRVIVQENRWGQIAPRRMKGQNIFWRFDQAGYPYVSLGRSRRSRVHVLVAETFIGPRPQGLFVLHDDDQKSHCAVHNLRYGTCADNHSDRIKNGNSPTGEKNPMAIFSENDIACAIALRGRVKTAVIAKALNTSPKYIYDLGRCAWRHVSAAPIEDATDWLATRQKTSNEKEARHG